MHKNLIKFNKSLIQINQDEINAIEGKWSFDSGTEVACTRPSIET